MSNEKLLDLSLVVRGTHPNDTYDPGQEYISHVQEQFIEEVIKLTKHYLRAGQVVLELSRLTDPSREAEYVAGFEKNCMGFVSLGAVAVATTISSELNKPEQLAAVVNELYHSVDDIIGAWKSFNETFSSQ